MNGREKIEFYIEFKGRIMVRADDWNEAEKEANKEFLKRGITRSSVKAIKIK